MSHSADVQMWLELETGARIMVVGIIGNHILLRSTVCIPIKGTLVTTIDGHETRDDFNGIETAVMDLRFREKHDTQSND